MCRQFGTKPLPEAILTYLKLAPQDTYQWHLNQQKYFFVNKIHWKMSCATWWPFCLGLNVLIRNCIDSVLYWHRIWIFLYRSLFTYNTRHFACSTIQKAFYQIKLSNLSSLNSCLYPMTVIPDVVAVISSHYLYMHLAYFLWIPKSANVSKDACVMYRMTSSAYEFIKHILRL